MENKHGVHEAIAALIQEDFYTVDSWCECVRMFFSIYVLVTELQWSWM